MIILNPTFWRIIPPNAQKSEMKGVTDSLWPSKLIKNWLFQKPTVNVIVKGANEWNKEGNSSHLRLRAGHVYLPNVEKEGKCFQCYQWQKKIQKTLLDMSILLSEKLLVNRETSKPKVVSSYSSVYEARMNKYIVFYFQ